MLGSSACRELAWVWFACRSVKCWLLVLDGLTVEVLHEYLLSHGCFSASRVRKTPDLLRLSMGHRKCVVAAWSFVGGLLVTRSVTFCRQDLTTQQNMPLLASNLQAQQAQQVQKVRTYSNKLAAFAATFSLVCTAQVM